MTIALLRMATHAALRAERKGVGVLVGRRLPVSRAARAVTDLITSNALRGGRESHLLYISRMERGTVLREITCWSLATELLYGLHRLMSCRFTGKRSTGYL